MENSNKKSKRLAKSRRVAELNPATEMRKETVISLFTSLVQEWKACVANVNIGGLESVNKFNGLIYRVLSDLNGSCAARSLRVNRYSDQRFADWIGRLYTLSSCPQVQVAPKVVEYALDTTDRIKDLCAVLGYKGGFSREWEEQTDLHYALLYVTRVWGKNLKYQSLWLFNHFERLEQVKRSEEIVGPDGYLCFGRPGSTIRRRLRGTSLKYLESRMTILQGFKKSLLPLEFEDWFATVKETRESLSAEAPDMSEEMYQELLRTGRELARRTPGFRVRDNMKLSSSACVESARSKGGFAGEQFRAWDLRSKKDPKDIGVVYRITPPFLVGDFRVKGSSEVGLVYSRCPYSYKDVFEENEPMSYTCLSNDVALVKIRVIPEPFKFRVISVGEFGVYSTLKPYQNMMWKTLQKFECFSLTGSGADDLLMKVESLVAKYWDVGRKFLSGDYKSATNLLSSYASKVLLSTWMADYPEFQWKMERSLFASRLDFSDAGLGVEGLLPGSKAESDEFTSVEMRNGQLMGHPCSFPILCAVNAAVCRMVLEKVWGRRFTLDDLPLLINGDDCLLIGPDSLLSEWRGRINEVGLVESVGKSYFTDRFAMINSRYLSIASVPVFEQGLECPVRYQGYVANDVGYVNLGILVGRKKGSNVDCEVNVAEKVDDQSAYAFWQSAADNFSQMNLRCKKLAAPLSMYQSSFERYFRRVGLPLYLPKEQGGYGFIPEKDGDLMELFQKVDPFRLPRDPRVMLGEAYYSGGMASQFDAMEYPSFLKRCKEFRGWLRGERILSQKPEKVWRISQETRQRFEELNLTPEEGVDYQMVKTWDSDLPNNRGLCQIMQRCRMVPIDPEPKVQTGWLVTC